MADLVRVTMEAMVPDLRNFIKRNVFTKQEVKEILKVRENFEYTFLRKTSAKKDYLKAIEYEYELESKRREQYKKLKIKKQTGRDYASKEMKFISLLIILRLTSKFVHDVELWKEYCLFCYKIRANRMFFKAVSNALTMNWDSLEIWLLAIYYHFEINKDPFKARKTFLKALKMNSKTKEFWLEYFRFELNFLQKIKQRKNITAVLNETGAENRNKNEKGDEEESENMDIEVHMGDENTLGGGKKKTENYDIMEFGEEENAENEAKKSKNKNAQNSGAAMGEFVSFVEAKELHTDEMDEIAMIIYEDLIEKFPQDFKVDAELIQICNEFKGKWIENIKEQLLTAALKRLVGNPQAIVLTYMEARGLTQKAFETEEDNILFEKVNRIEADIRKYAKKEAQDQTVQQAMFEELLHKLLSYYRHQASIKNSRAKAFTSIFSAVLKNMPHKKVSEDRLVRIYEGLAPFVSETAHLFDELRLLHNHIAKLPSSTYNTLDRVAELSLKFSEQDLSDFEELAAVIKKYLKANKSATPHLFQAKLYIHLFKLENIIRKKSEVLSFFKDATRYLYGTQEFGLFAAEFLKNLIDVYSTHDPLISDCFLELFRFKAGCPLSVSNLYIENLEKVRASNPEIKKHLQKVIDWHPQNRELWLKLIEWEKRHGNPLACPDTFQKAQRHIKDSDFVHEYTELMSKP